MLLAFTEVWAFKDKSNGIAATEYLSSTLKLRDVTYKIIYASFYVNYIFIL